MYGVKEKVGAAAKRGDPVARQVVERAAGYLAIGVLNLIHLVGPQVVILGGGVTRLDELPFDPIREFVARCALTARQRTTPILSAALDDLQGS